MVHCLVYCVPVPPAPPPAKDILGVKPTTACQSPDGQSTHIHLLRIMIGFMIRDQATSYG